MCSSDLDLRKIQNLVKVYNLEEYTTDKEIFAMKNHKILEILEKRLGVSKNDEHNYEIIKISVNGPSSNSIFGVSPKLIALAITFKPIF